MSIIQYVVVYEDFARGTWIRVLDSLPNPSKMEEDCDCFWFVERTAQPVLLDDGRCLPGWKLEKISGRYFPNGTSYDDVIVSQHHHTRKKYEGDIVLNKLLRYEQPRQSDIICE